MGLKYGAFVAAVRARPGARNGTPMELLIVRHGPAEERDPARWPDDADRPLTAEGIRETRRSFRGLARLGFPTRRVVSSPAARAEATARILRDALDVSAPVVVWDELAPDGSAVPVLGRLRETPGLDGAALVGHEPTLSELIGLALTGDPTSVAKLGKAGAAQLSFAQRAVPAGGELIWLLTRKQLALLARPR